MINYVRNLNCMSQCGGIDKRTIEKFEKEAQESGKVKSLIIFFVSLVMMRIADSDTDLL